jgi:hypothetical protein
MNGAAGAGAPANLGIGCRPIKQRHSPLSRLNGPPPRDAVPRPKSGRPGFAVGQGRFPTNDTLHFFKKSAPHQKKLAFLGKRPIIPTKISLTSVLKPPKKALFERAWWVFFLFDAAAAG